MVESESRGFGFDADGGDVVFVETAQQQGTAWGEHGSVAVHVAEQYVAVDVGHHHVETFVGGEHGGVAEEGVYVFVNECEREH